jgi:uncharacterized protein (DUF1778 family)
MPAMASKRIVQVNVRMTIEDYKALEQAAKRLWRGAVMSRSSLVLSLALLGAESAEGSKPVARKGG